LKIEFWFEFASTYSYPAAMRIEQVAAARGIGVRWRSFLLGPIFAAQGWRDSPFNIYPVKGRYMWRDLERSCDALGIPFLRPTVFPRSGLRAARVCARYAQAPWLPTFVRSVYEANFARDLDISSESVLEECVIAIGQDPAVVLAEAQTPAAKDALRAQNGEAVQKGVFGAPSFVVDEELFWGNDRLEAALAWRASHAASIG
jgi:2-hydroxychromene-2-carboxylate isomerase